ncbi:hypothetical protein HDK90DRAFT_357220 [Phyllosticta capitalensis]|uniref:Uncharacterized protein n=1 Tax=Phyllosticta capitalensis TaxID=121624 RepID=A0ABR1YJ32_9PEZI
MVGRDVHIPASRTAYRHTKAANTITRSSNRPPLSLTHAVNLRLVLLSSQSSLSQSHLSIIYSSIPSTNQSAKMLASTITSALALFAAVASAAPSPAVAAPNVAAAPAVDLNAFKTKYYWNLTNLISYSPGSRAYRTLGFTAAFSAQQNTTSCQSSNGVTGSFQPCDNPAVTFKADLGVNNVTISQLFVYNGVNIRVNGSAPLDLWSGVNTPNCYSTRTLTQICSESQVSVNVTSAVIVTPSKKGN